MSRRKKDRVKEARAREKERLSGTSSSQLEHVSESEPAPVSEEPARPIRHKDSKGKKIPTESERRAKGQIRNDVAPKHTEKPNKPSKPAKSHELKIFFLKIASHPFLVALGVIVAIIIGVSIYGTIEQNMRPENMPKEDAKSISLIGITQPAKRVIEDTGKYDVFWEIPDASGISWAELFDRNITNAEQKVLEERGQALDDGYQFTYNEEISSAKSAKDAAEQQVSDAGTIMRDNTENENNGQLEEITPTPIFDE